jgi:GNAT superfamily N-acetyltransferase
MFWRLPPTEYEEAFRRRSLEAVGGGPNKEAMAALVAGGEVPGLLAYRDGLPVGWVSVSPRNRLRRLDHVATLDAAEQPADARTWSISCFYVHRSGWRTGIGASLLDAAVSRAAQHGASSVEGYPVKASSIDPYTGYDTMFADAGFRQLRPGRGKGRAVWRRTLSG